MTLLSFLPEGQWQEKLQNSIPLKQHVSSKDVFKHKAVIYKRWICIQHLPFTLYLTMNPSLSDCWNRLSIMIGSAPTEMEETEEISSTTGGTCFFNLIFIKSFDCPLKLYLRTYMIFSFCSFWCLRMENGVRSKTSQLAIYTRPSPQQQRFQKSISEC